MKNGKLEVSVELKELSGLHFIRISVGDSMYFDTPNTFEVNATNIYNNLVRRLE